MKGMHDSRDRHHSVAGHTMYPPPELRALSDQELLSRLDSLAHEEREGTADVVEHLSELERREKSLDLAYPSIYEYCIKRLGYTESGAYFRVRAAQAAIDFPDIIPRLREGRLHLESVVRLYPHLTSENSFALLSQADGASKRDVQALVATLQPESPPERDVITPVAGARTSERSSGVVVPTQHRFHFTADDELFRLVSRLRALLRHRIPDGRLESIFKEAARVLLEKLDAPPRRNRRKTPSNTGKVPREQRKGSRLVPRRIKKEVWLRDGGRCVFRAEDGTLCGSREALEYDHIVAWADGGRSDTPDNIRLLCRAHNQRLGRRRFGDRRRR